MVNDWNPETYAETAPFNVTEAGPVLALLAPESGERILDLGCGDGVLTEKLVQMGASVVGVDASEAQVQAAIARGLDARVADGHHLSFFAEFDAVFSNAALHWLLDPDAAIASIKRALRPGGRLVAEFGGHGNVAAVRVAVHSALRSRGVASYAAEPWYFPTAAAYAERLERAGFVVKHHSLTPRPTPLPTGIEGWLREFAQTQLANVPDTDRPALLEDIAARLQPVLFDPDSGWIADYVRLRVVAIAPG